MLEDIRREKEAEDNNKLPLEQEDTSLLQATEILQQPEISNRRGGRNGTKRTHSANFNERPKTRDKRSHKRRKRLKRP
ncbi:hypothetical protein EYF80_014193 [Liparis tanakae]|uniref:Uncharacterized protein n=1 Tax=Liparis tanakae TaxID=230148 RepID=A0A4Z2IC82_9TELE|nr:hypothetical protein EYF80_014193 [Liparis tanakae]